MNFLKNTLFFVFKTVCVLGEVGHERRSSLLVSLRKFEDIELMERRLLAK